MAGFDMSDYVPVQERIEAFYKQHPMGSLQSEIVELTGERVTVKAFAFRAPDDPHPGVGHSSLEIPGKTTFTRGSEIENAETSAWGRAIAALGFEVKRGVASREEVANKQPQNGERAPATGGRAGSRPATTRSGVSQYRRGELVDLMGEYGLNLPAVEAIAQHIGIPRDERPMSDASMDLLIAAIETPADGVPTAPPALDTPPQDEPSSPVAATEAAEGVAPPAPSAAPAPTDAEILAAAGPGAELIPPKPGTPEYRALPTGTERSQAKAYWDRKVKEDPEPETLAEQLEALA